MIALDDRVVVRFPADLCSDERVRTGRVVRLTSRTIWVRLVRSGSQVIFDRNTWLKWGSADSSAWGTSGAPRIERKTGG